MTKRKSKRQKSIKSQNTAGLSIRWHFEKRTENIFFFNFIINTYLVVLSAGPLVNENVFHLFLNNYQPYRKIGNYKKFLFRSNLYDMSIIFFFLNEEKKNFLSFLHGAPLLTVWPKTLLVVNTIEWIITCMCKYYNILIIVQHETLENLQSYRSNSVRSQRERTCLRAQCEDEGIA